MNNTISITPISKEDAETLRDLAITTFRASHGHSASDVDIDAYINAKFTVENIAAELSDASNVFHFIYCNGELAGYSKIIYNTPYENLTPPNSTKLERLYVLEKFYDRKLGKQLMDFNLNLAKQNGQSGVWLYVWTENHRAVRFYNNYGFQQIAETSFQISARHANPNWILSLAF
jgi:ribosomal protein S18 acetylase RimI-like enzyme